MQQLQELIIEGQTDDIKQLFQQIKTVVQNTPNWKLNQEKTKEATRFPGLAVDYNNQQGTTMATLYFTQQSANRLQLSKLTPATLDGITKTEYNFMVQSFAAEIVNPAIQQSLNKYKVTLTEAEVTVDTLLPPDLAKQLKSFSTNAPLDMSHSYDREEWRNFIIAVYKAGIQLDAVQLERLLVEDLGWWQGQATELAADYETGLDLLQAYHLQDQTVYA